MKVIAFVGKLRSGKDTAFNLLKKKYPNKVFRFSFADEMKKEAGNALGFTEEEFKKILEKDKELFRPYLQWYGTDYSQIYKKDRYVWVNKLDNILRETKLPEESIAIITDVRFKHELELLQKKYDTLVVRIERRSFFRKIFDNLKQRFIQTHSSETELDRLSCPIIYNRGTKQEFLQNILKVITIDE